MRFDRSEDELMIRDMVRDWAASRLQSGAAERDEAQTTDGGLFAEAGELGLAGMLAPADHGGSELTWGAAVQAFEELARHDGSFAMSLAEHCALGTEHLVRAGSRGARAMLLASATTGEALVAWSAGVDSSVTATKKGGDWTLDGTAAFVPLAALSRHLVLSATTDDGRRSFIVDLVNASIEPVNVHGLRSLGLADVSLDGVTVEGSSDLGSWDAALISALMAQHRVAAAAVGVGIARGALTDALAYAQEREQFGKPISAFQAIQFKLADMSASVDAARLLVLAAAHALDSGQDAAALGTLALESARESATLVCDEALQIHGGYGYTREYPIERYYRDSQMIDLRHRGDAVDAAALANAALGL